VALLTTNTQKMNLQDFLKQNPEINLTVKSGELFEFGQQIADQTVKTFLQQYDQKIYSRKDVLQKFGISGATLWRWTRLKLIESKKIGNRVFYPESGIKRLMSQKGGEK
jgi:predicted DNA-binding transcriptional regulator AlpA